MHGAWQWGANGCTFIDGRLALQGHEARDGGPIDIGIQQSHSQPRVLCQGNCQVHCVCEPAQVKTQWHARCTDWCTAVGNGM